MSDGDVDCSVIIIKLLYAIFNINDSQNCYNGDVVGNKGLFLSQGCLLKV
jgi:hypothetical protein